jgi:hypothetical protein
MRPPLFYFRRPSTKSHQHGFERPLKWDETLCYPLHKAFCSACADIKERQLLHKGGCLLQPGVLVYTRVYLVQFY